MKESLLNQSTGPRLSARTMGGLIFAALIVLLAAELALALAQARLREAAVRSQDLQFTSYLLANELRRTSDDLTRMARSFAATGDPIYELFYRDILAIRDGRQPRPPGYAGIYWDFLIAARRQPQDGGTAAPLADRLRQLGFAPDELAKLEQSMGNSLALANLEQTAMNAVRGRFRDQDGNFTVEGPPDFDLARRLLHGPDYLAAKVNTLRPIAELLVLLEQRTGAEVESRLARASLLTQGQLWLLALLLLLLGAAWFLLDRRLLKPLPALERAAQRILRGDRDHRTGLAPQGPIGQVARALDQALDQLGSVSAFRQELSAEVETLRDAEAQSRKLREQLQQQSARLTADREQLSREIHALQQAEAESRKLNERLEQRLVQQTADMDELIREVDLRRQAEAEARRRNEALEERVRELAALAVAPMASQTAEQEGPVRPESLSDSPPPVEPAEGLTAEAPPPEQTPSGPAPASEAEAGIEPKDPEMAAEPSPPLPEPSAPVPEASFPPAEPSSPLPEPSAPVPDASAPAPEPPASLPRKGRGRKRAARQPTDPAWEQAELIPGPIQSEGLASAVPPEMTEEELPSRLEGLEVTACLRRLAGNWELYRRLLGRFRDSQGRVVDRIRQALGNGEREMALRLIQSLKTMAGEVGAREVMEAARTLDLAFKKKDQEELEAVLPRLEEAIERVIASIRQLGETE